MLKIVEILPEPIHRIPYVNAKSGGGMESKCLELLRARVTGLPRSCAAILVTSDLQGFAPSWSEAGAIVLLGHVLAEQLEQLAEDGTVPALASIGVVLAGDLYSIPGAVKRGGFGDVSGVWHSFANSFRWVVGVAGNHDGFGSPRNKARLSGEPNVHLLHGEVVEVDGIHFGGVGYIAGDPKKPGRRSHDEQAAALELVLDEAPDVLVLHQGPRGGTKQQGDQGIRACIDAGRTPLTVCGHRHWNNPLASSNRHQFLNTDSRAVLLTP